MISVIVPVYNAESFLRECLDSIAAQTYRDIEVIMVDDGSTDRSGAIVDEYSALDNRFEALHIDNGGQARARNLGIEKSRGEWVSFVDADDCLQAQAFEMLAAIAGRDDSQIVIGTCSQGLHFVPGTFCMMAESRVLDAEGAIAECLYQTGDVTSSPWGRIFRREMFDGVRFSDGMYYEDLLITPFLFEQAGRISVCPLPLYFYRSNPSSFLNTWTSKRLDVLEVTERVERFIAERHPSLLPAARDRRLSANFNMFVLASGRGDEEVLNRTWPVIKSLRRQSLLNPRVRIKNRLGILVSYGGKRLLRTISRFWI